MTLEELYDAGVSYSEIARRLGMTKANVANLVTQLRIRRGEFMAEFDPEVIRRKYIDEATLVDDLIAEMGVSKARFRQFCYAHGIRRDRGHIYRAGTKEQVRKGKRVPGSVRDLKEQASAVWSPEHRAKLAVAKLGRTGEASNRWKGGHEIGGYEGTLVNGQKRYMHRRIVEDLIGRPLLREEQVHHMDLDRKNNAPENLLVLGRSEHTKLHVAMRKTPGLDQRQWLKDQGFYFEDVIAYA